MKIKRYVVREMQEAIRLIKQDLGSEALIVSTYKVPAKGIAGLFTPRRLEVTAVLDDNPEPKLAAPRYEPEQIEAPELKPSQPRQLPVGRETPYTPRESLSIEEPAGRRGGKWPVETRSLFDTMVKDQVEAMVPGGPLTRWRRALIDMEIQENIAEHLLSFLEDSNLPEPDEGQLYQELYKQIAALMTPAYQTRERARILTFIGPAGVGKTSTLVKLAAGCSINDHKKIVLVTINMYRMVADEQLKAYGAFLDIPVEEVMTPAELARALEKHNDKDYIFIDTVGRSANNIGQLLELRSFINTVPEPKDVFLVLSSATKNRDLERIVRQFQKTGYSQMIFTRIDETATYGGMLNLICSLGLPVAYLTNGQEIPDDIIKAEPQTIAKLLLKGVYPNEVMAP